MELILSQISYVDSSAEATMLQKQLSVGQSVVDKGNIWRWDGFISEENRKIKISSTLLLEWNHLKRMRKN